MSNLYDVIVVGGGAVGCAITWRLGQSGRKVLLLERGQLGGEASSAAGGMLGAQLEVSNPGPFFQLCMESRDLHRSFASELYEATGIDVQYSENGILRIAATEEEAEILKASMSWQKNYGGQSEWLSEREAVELEPAACAKFGALLLPKDGNVMAPLLSRAVGVAAARYGTVIEGAEVVDIRVADHHATVLTPTHTYEAEKVVVAAGAWADKIIGTMGASFDISPVKGQIFSICPPGKVKLTRTLFRDHTYLVPKRDGTVVVGATEEHDSGYNRDVTLGALSHLLSAMKQVAPGLLEARFERAWVGFRPKSGSGFPSIGPVSWSNHLYVAVGHFRNGVLLTPVTAKMIAAHMDDKPISDVWGAFVPDGSERNKQKEAGVLSL